MPRWRLLTAGLLTALVSLDAGAQCAVGNGTAINDGGWFGHSASMDCVGGPGSVWADFTGLTPDAGGFGGVVRDEAGALPLVHLARYAVQVSRLLEDGGRGGLLGTSFTVTADVVPPAAPQPPLVAVDGGQVTLTIGPLSDDGQGAVQVEAAFRLQGSRSSEVGPEGVNPTRLDWDLGPGVWTAELQTLDAPRNYGGRAVSASFTIATDGMVAPPSPPVPTSALFRTVSISARVQEPADAYHFLVIEADGGRTSGPFWRHAPATAMSVAHGYLPRECAFRVIASRVVGGVPSAWSAPSTEFRVDLEPPSTPSAFVATATDAGVELSWLAATDTCSGVGGYRLERAVDGGWLTVAVTSSLTLLDQPPEGLASYRLSATDDAGFRSDFTRAQAQWPPGQADAGSVDAGAPEPADGGLVVDAGLAPPDAGVADVDAGSDTVDAGASPVGVIVSRGLTVGCGCSSASALPLALLLLVAWRRRH